MFWGLILEPRRRYTQVVTRPFHISMAALDLFSSTADVCQLMITFEERNYLLCTLQVGHAIQCPLDLHFEIGDTVVFASNGKSNIHLTGYLTDENDLLEGLDEEVAEANKAQTKKRKLAKTEEKPKVQPPLKRTKTLLDKALNDDSSDDESFSLSNVLQEDDADVSSDSDEDDVNMEGEDEGDDEESEASEDDLSSLSDEEDEEDDEEEEAAAEDLKPKQNGAASKKKEKEAPKKPMKTEPASSPVAANKTPKKEHTKQPEKSPTAKLEKTPKVESSQKATKKRKSEVMAQKDATPAKSPSQPLPQNQKRTLEGGVIVQDLKVGEGPSVKSGKMVQVYYEGRLLKSNKVFDKLKQGPGFKFRLGKGEVIKGWDAGVTGMKVGGTRRITCPPNMAYGAKGSSPQIPPNSTLVFDVELKNIK